LPLIIGLGYTAAQIRAAGQPISVQPDIEEVRRTVANSELVQLKLNIETSVGDSTPTKSRDVELPLIEVGV
jgi:hypothetical protein